MPISAVPGDNVLSDADVRSLQHDPPSPADGYPPPPQPSYGDRGPDKEPRSVPMPVGERRSPKLLLNPNQPERHNQIVTEVLRMFQRAREHKRPLLSIWNQAYRFLRNDYWPNSRQPWLPSPSIPEIEPIVHALVAWELDQRPEPNVTPYAEENTFANNYYGSLARDMETILKASYHNNDEELEWSRAAWDKYLYGTGILKTMWDGSLAGGLGDAKTRRVNPFYIYPNPGATSENDLEYIFEVYRLSVQELDRRFPGSGQLMFTASASYGIEEPPDQMGRDEGHTEHLSPAAIPPATVPQFGRGSTNGPTTPNFNDDWDREVTVLECWSREHYLHEVTDPGTGDSRFMVVEQWRVRVVVNDHLLLDEPAANIHGHGQHPYDRVVRYDIGEFWGFSLVEHLISPQKALNRIIAAIQQNIELAGNPMLKHSGGVSREAMVNKPGQRFSVGPNAAQNDAEWLPPPQMDQSLVGMKDWILTRMEAISGLTSVMKGNTPSGRTAQGIVDAVQEAGFIRIRDSLRHKEYAMKGALEKKAALIVENYTVPRKVAVSGDGEKEHNMLFVHARHFIVPGPNGGTPMEHTIRVEAGSQKHASRQMREDRANQMWLTKLIPRAYALKEMGVPNAQEIAEQAAQEHAQEEGVGERERARST